MNAVRLFSKLDVLLALVVFPPTIPANELEPSLILLVQIFHQFLASARQRFPP